MTAEDLRKSILQQAIQGKLVPQDPNDEPAAVLLERIREEKARLIKEKKIKKDKNESIIFRGDDNSHYEKILATGEVKCIDDEIPFEIPDSWEWERWGNISQSIQYGYNAPALNNGDVRMVRISDIQNGNVQWESVPYCNIPESEIANYLLSENDILFARTGGTVGKSFIVSETPYPVIYAGYLIRTRYSKLLSARYMKYFMESELYWTQLREGTIATAQPNCNGKTLGKMLLPIPPYLEQYRIVKKIEDLAPIINKYHEAAENINNLDNSLNESIKKSILQYAIQGKLVPQVDSEEPASALLEKIRAEKLQLLKEGKLKKKDIQESFIFKDDDNRYYEKVGSVVNDITDEIPYELPNNWSFVRLSSICYLDDGTKASGEKLPYMDAKFHRGKGEIVYLTQGKIVEPPCKAILVDGENSGEIFNITERGYLGSTFKILQISSCIFEEWLHLLLDAYRDLFKNSKVGAAIPHLNKNLFRNLIIGLPPYEEQIRITKNVIKLQKSIEGL